MPQVVVHNPVLAYENGAEFMEAWYQAERGELDPFVLVLEGSIPNEEINGEGHWTGMGTNPVDRASRSPPTSGSTAWRRRPRRSWPSAPAPPTAASPR